MVHSWNEPATFRSTCSRSSNLMQCTRLHHLFTLPCMATPMDAEYMYHINSTRTENIRICEISVTTHPYRLLINNYGTCKTLPRVRLMQATHIYIMLVLLLVSGNISQLEESKCIDQKDAGSIPLRATIFLPTVFACWHMSL